MPEGDHHPNMRRIEPFLFRCAELDKLDAIRRVVGAIMDNLLYSPKLFEIAEELLERGRHAAALLLYGGELKRRSINIPNVWQSVNIAYSRFKLEAIKTVILVQLRFLKFLLSALMK